MHMCQHGLDKEQLGSQQLDSDREGRRAGIQSGREAGFYGGGHPSSRAAGQPKSGANRGQREHKGSFRGYPQKGVVRCSLDSRLLLSSFFA